MKISPQKLWCLIWCWQKKLNVQRVKELLHVSIPTIRRYYELFRDNLNLEDHDIILKGKVQMDEMFVKGGFIIGGKDIKKKQLKFYVRKKKYPDKSDAMNFMYHHIQPGSVVCTDGSGIYRGCENWWPVKHIKEIHSKFEFEITSEIEGIWGVLRTFIRRMYHHVTFKKLPKIVPEFEARESQQSLFENPFNLLKNALSLSI